MPPGFAEPGIWTSTPWENRELAQVPSSSVTRCECGWDKRLWLETAFWTRGRKATRSYLASSFPLSHLQCERSPGQPAAAVNNSWPVTSLHCQQPDKLRTMQARPFHSIIPAQSMGRGWWQLWSSLVIVTHEKKDKCTGNLECWGEDWVTTAETGFSAWHLHISSEEGWPPVLKALGATNLQWSKAWWHKSWRPTLQTFHCQLTSERSQHLLLAKVH